MHTTLIYCYNDLCGFIFVSEPRRLKPLGNQYDVMSVDDKSPLS